MSDSKKSGGHKQKSIMSKRKKKYLAALPLILMTALAFSTAINFIGGEDEPDDTKFIVQGENKEYTFYSLEDGTFGTFVYQGTTQIPIEFRLDPRNASQIDMEKSNVIEQMLSSDKIYITFNPNQENLGDVAVAAAEVSRITGKVYNVPTIGAFTEDSDPVDPNVPLRTCNDVIDQEEITVIEIKVMEGLAPKITKNNNCIRIIAGDSKDLVLAADKLGMHLIGINL